MRRPRTMSAGEIRRAADRAERRQVRPALPRELVLRMADRAEADSFLSAAADACRRASAGADERPF